MKDVSHTNDPAILELRRNALFLRCAYDAAGRLSYKFESVDDAVTEYGYAFDAAGHLKQVTRNGSICEEYRYNKAGQRMAQRRSTPYGMPWETELLHYDAQGRLTSAGDVGFEYDGQGALAGRYTQYGVTAFSYGQDTRLDMAVLSTKAKIRYEYAGIHPVRRYRCLTLTGEYLWEGDRLVTFFNHDLQLEYSFRYAESDVPGVVVLDTVTLRPLPASRRQKFPKDTDWAKECADWLPGMSAESQRQRLWAWLESWHQCSARNPLTLYAGCDQVGSLRVLTDRFGRVVKDVRRDSFGVLLSDSFPDLFMPLGFAGGLEDPGTSLVRFGWRDYDPSVGRFTAPDPAKDRRGDGDMYDYCVDDPVSRVDVTGLAWSQAAAVAGGKSHGSISHSFGGPHGQAGDSGGETTARTRESGPLDGGRMVAAAANVRTVTDARGGTAPAAQQAQAANTNLPLGVRNNNPMNVVDIGRHGPWEGQDGTNGGFARFETPEAGLRAGAITIISHQARHNRNTVQEIISRHANTSPHAEQVRYAQHVARELGITPEAQVNVQDPAILPRMMRAMIEFENGRAAAGRYTDEQLNTAANAGIAHHNR